MKVLALLLNFVLLFSAASAKVNLSVDKTKLFGKSKSATILALKNGYAETPKYNEWDLTYNLLKFNVNPSIKYISGSVLFQFTAKINNLSVITIDLDNALTVDSILSNGAKLTYTRQSGFVSVNLGKVLSINNIGDFTVFYKGAPPASGFGSFTQSNHSGQPIIFTLSEPYGAKEWFPCKQSLVDKVDSIDVIVISPSSARTASNGVLVEDIVTGSNRTCHWKHRHPIATYLIAISVTNYSVYQESVTLGDGTVVPILNYVYPESLELAKSSTPITANLISFFSSKFIDYPFKNEKYGHAQFGWGGGMEHQTMSFMGGFSFELIAHELAHQWFGNYITCGSWHEIWINEGFATYLTGLSYEALDTTWWPQWKEKSIKSVTSNPNGSVYCDDTTDVYRIFSSRLSYTKGAYVLHMLRGQIGDKKFFEGMKRYLNDPRVVNGFATTALYRENMEATADTSLVEFFNDWIMGQGFPKYSIQWNHKNGVTNASIKQAPSATNGPFFEMKLPLRLVGSVTDTIVWVHNTYNDQLYSIPTSFEVKSIEFDPQKWILGTSSISTGFELLSDSSSIKIFPNPAVNSLKIRIPKKKALKASIYNSNGALFKSLLISNSETIIDISQFNSGVYFIKFEGDGISQTKSFLKQ